MPRAHVFDEARHGVHDLAPLMEPTHVRCIRRRLRSRGLALIPPSHMRLGGADRADLRAVSASFDSLAPDPYDRAGNRYRAHGELTLETNRGYPVITKLARSSYRQSARLNPSEAGRERVFGPLPQQLHRPLLWRMVLGMLACLPDAIRRTPTLRIQIHQLSYRADGRPSVSPPLALHRDGEPFTAVVLVGARDLRGGDTMVADDQGRLLLGHTMATPLETLLLEDAKVLHAVTPVLHGRRDVLLIDYTPKLPHVVT